MTAEACVYAFHGLDFEGGMSQKDARLYARLNAKMPVEVKVLPPPKQKGWVRHKRVVLYLHKMVIIDGWRKVCG